MNLYNNLQILLTPELLENNPQIYLEFLYYYDNNKINISNKINTNTDMSEHSNHLFCLVYLVGDLVNDSHEIPFYGDNTSISQTLGIEILRLLVKLGINTHDTCGNQTIYSHIRNGKYLTKRKNNIKFINEVMLLEVNANPSQT